MRVTRVKASRRSQGGAEGGWKDGTAPLVRGRDVGRKGAAGPCPALFSRPGRGKNSPSRSSSMKTGAAKVVGRIDVKPS